MLFLGPNARPRFAAASARVLQRRTVFSNSKTRKIGVLEAYGVEGVVLGWVFVFSLGFAFQWSLKDQEKQHKLAVFQNLRTSFKE